MSEPEQQFHDAAQAIRAAVVAEREACAKIADELHALALADLKKNVTEDAKLVNDARQAMAGHIAAAIRQRTQPQ